MKTYVGVYPHGRITFLRDYDGKDKEEYEKNISKFVYNVETIYEFLSTVKKSFDDPPDYMCIINDFWFHKYMFISKAKEIGLKNFEIIEEYKAKSLEAIFESGYNLENNNIIWTCLKAKFCIWQGKFCVNNKYKALEDLMIQSRDKHEAFEIIEFPPDVLIYENFEGNSIDCDVIRRLFPECKIFEFKQKIPTICALIYAQFMEIKDYSDNFLNSKRRKNSVTRNNKNFPITFIHVAIDISSKTISASYYHNRTRKTFTFNVKGTLLIDDQTGWKQIEKKLKIAESRLNGKFLWIRFFNEENEFCLQWAKEMGFKQIKVYDERKLRYDEIVSYLPFKLQESDIIWIQQKSNIGYHEYTYDLDIYEIWKGNEYQRDIRPKDLKQKPSIINYIPIYVISNKDTMYTDIYQILGPLVYEIKNSRIKDYFPKNCRFFFYENEESFSNMLIKYAQTMADEYYSLLGSTSESNTESISEMEHLKFHPNKITKGHSLITNIKELKLETFELKESNNNVFKFFQFINNDNHPSIVGIDLGTSRCCAAVNRKNGIETVPLGHTGSRLLPSYVSYDEENPICGEVVVNRLPQFSSSTIFDSKRIIGRNLSEIEININWPFRISLKNGNKVIIEVKKGDKKVHKSAEEVSKDLLKYIKEKSEEFQSKPLDNVVITVTAAFNKSQKEATLYAAKLADWNEIILLPEPIAAAYTYFMDQKIPENSTVLLFDLGGGTLDVCIFKTENNAIKIISNTGDSKLGGRDFDTVLFNYFKEQLLTQYGITLKKDKKFQLILECQNIKEDLSVLESSNLNTDDYDPKIDKLIPINRTHFETLTKPLLNRIQKIVNSSLMNSNKNPEEINIILMVGGGSRMPMIKNLLKELFPKAEQCIHQNPDEVVAIGAAYYACSFFKSAETAAEW